MKKRLYKESKDIMATGITSMIGYSALGSIANVTGNKSMMPILGTGFTLVNAGQLLKSTKNIFGRKSKW